ncbi:pilus assembly protein PilP [Salinivibrio sp. ES.052]|uniref:pilus assembly protein PilP n=1 Tax=Salinivibrio sp. ES.052 TaxID=1882823 RepID=UPI000929A2D5|nr:pilus assembly protein PilP [Salinivibrio sp. ES.052]SIO18139.1 type IV pilus assembly protein PilP [Salinivibrio sp. ES.052]
MMFRVCVWVLLFILSGCQGEDSDIRHFMQQVRGQAAVTATRIPPPPKYHSVAFVHDHRDPFALPAASGQQRVSPGDCWQPSFYWRETPLSTLSLEQLAMKGSLTKGGQKHALIALPNGVVTQVAQGDRLGQHHGRVMAVNHDHVAIKQVLPDGLGCWQQRTVTLSIAPNLS